MRYESKVTVKGNSSYSYSSQAQADERAKFLDDNNCTNCTDCIGLKNQADQNGEVGFYAAFESQGSK